MATGIGNPVGYVPVFGDDPRVITGKAAAVISGGTLCIGSTAAGAISSGLNSFVTSDIAFVNNASGLEFTGVALHDAASGATLSVATRGAVIALCEGTVTAGRTVITGGANGIVNGVTAGTVVGKALTSAGSEGFALFDING